MKLVRFAAHKGAQARLGVVIGAMVYDLEARPPRPVRSGDMRALLAQPPAVLRDLVDAAMDSDPVPADDEHLLCPLPDPGKFLAQAANYYQPGAPRLPDVATPWFFSKMTDRVLGPGEPIVLWSFAPDIVEEIEVAIVIGKPGRRIPEERALEHVAGYTICNDVSGRRLDLPTARRSADFDGFIDWLNGKWMDGFSVLGPAIVTPDEMPPLDGIELTTRVSGDVRVHGSTRDIVHGFAQAIAFASRFLTLRTGDVIATGMPHGPGPEVFLKAGDIVEGDVSGLGILRNPVVAETSHV